MLHIFLPQNFPHCWTITARSGAMHRSFFSANGVEFQHSTRPSNDNRTNHNLFPKGEVPQNPGPIGLSALFYLRLLSLVFPQVPVSLIVWWVVGGGGAYFLWRKKKSRNRGSNPTPPYLLEPRNESWRRSVL